MSLSGPDALRALEEALRDVRREEDEIAKRASRGVELLVKLHAQEAELYRLLGDTLLTDAERTEQDRLIADVDNAVETAISRYEATFADAEAAVQHAEADIARGNAERSALQSEAGRHDSELRAHAAAARPRLGSDAGYAGKLVAARKLAVLAEASREKASRAEADSDSRLGVWRADPLFMYLSGRYFGTAQYASRGMFAALDRRLAEYIGYEQAAANYRAARDLPFRLRQHAEQMQERADIAAAEIATLESGAIDSAGGRAAREAIEALAPRIDALDAENVTLQDRRDEAIARRSELARGDAPASNASLDQLAGMLQQPTLRPLLALARNGATDDAGVVGQLDDLAQRTRDEAAEVAESAAQLRILAQRRRDLEDIQFEIRRRGYDNPHSQFDDGRLAQEWLNEFLRGGLNANAYWERWRQAQSWTTPGYGGPGGGWGRLGQAATGAGLGRPRPGRTVRRLTSAA